MRISSLFAAAALTLASGAAFAAPYKIDLSHAHIGFTVDHLGFSKTYARFNSFDGEIDFDPDNPAEAQATFTIDASSVDSNWAARDEHIRKEDFLNVEAHPEIIFTITDVEMTDEQSAVVTGDLTMVGQTHSETFDVTLSKRGPSPFTGQEVIGFSGTGSIDRAKYGIEFGVPAIGQNVEVVIDFEMSPVE